MANKAYEPTDESRRAVQIMAGLGMPQDKICLVLGVTLPTLHKYFRDELDTAGAKLESSLQIALVEIALAKGSGAVGAAAFLLKSRFGYKETTVLETPDKKSWDDFSDAELLELVAQAKAEREKPRKETMN